LVCPKATRLCNISFTPSFGANVPPKPPPSVAALSLPGSISRPISPFGKSPVPNPIAEYISFALGILLVAIVAMLGYRAWKTSRVSPEELERQRRAQLVANGKMGDATLVDFRDNNLFYSYFVRGVEYTASQEVASLAGRVPEDLSAAGPVAVKYDPRNPANSIVVAEQWSGLRK
jgi:hypothetical protein